MAIAARSAVLAVHEDPVMRKFVRRILESAGLGCVEAADGESGFKLAVDVGVSAAVVDLVLPGMSGAELAWRLREEIPGLPVVAVSGRLDLWDADDLRDLGICKVLPKPFEQMKLVRAVADALVHPFARSKLARPGGPVWSRRRPVYAGGRRFAVGSPAEESTTGSGRRPAEGLGVVQEAERRTSRERRGGRAETAEGPS